MSEQPMLTAHGTAETEASAHQGEEAEATAEELLMTAEDDSPQLPQAEDEGPKDKLGKDLPYWRTTKNTELPEEFWDHRRQLRNRNRSLRNKANRRERNEAKRQEEEKELAVLSAEEAAAKKEEAYQKRIKAHLEQQERLEDGLKNGVRIAVECSFIEEFSEREVRSMAKQLEYSVVANKRSPKPTALTFCSWKGSIASVCSKVGSERWPVNREEKPVNELFPTDEIIMLSPDGEEVLQDIDPTKVYCIGGIVDRTTKKNLTKGWADTNGVKSVRLPIDEFCPLPGEAAKGHGKRHVLNINDVVIALLEYNVSKDWTSALDVALPERKKRPETGAKHAKRKRNLDMKAQGNKEAKVEAATSEPL